MFGKQALFSSSDKNKNLVKLWLVSFDVVFISVPIHEVRQVARNKPYMDHIFMECSHMQISDIVELWVTCLRTTYFWVEAKFLQGKESMAMGSSLSPVVRNIFKDHFKIFHCIQ